MFEELGEGRGTGRGFSLWYCTAGAGEGITKFCPLSECCAVRECLDAVSLLLHSAGILWRSTVFQYSVDSVEEAEKSLTFVTSYFALVWSL